VSETNAAPAGATTETVESVDILDQVLSATKQTEKDHAQDLVSNLVKQALGGTVTFDRNLTRTFARAIEAIDRKLSIQFNAVMHDPKFTKLEGSWRGLHHLVMNSETSTNLKIRMLNITKRELNRDLTKAVEFDQSQLFKKIYENEFGTPGGEPYGAFVGDYEWTRHPDDIDTLRLMSNISAAAFAPFLSAADSQMLGMDSWTELTKPRDLAKIFDSPEYMKWRSFRDSEDSRFVSLVMPRVIARLPYGAETKPIDEFAYEEAPADAAGAAKPMQHGEYCWMNAAYVMGARMTDAFAKYGFCTMIRGAEGGGKVENLPTVTPIPSARPRSASPSAASSSCPILASCPSATTRTPITRSSSAARRCRSRRNTIGRTRRRTPRSLPGCRISWRPPGSPIS
jgi:type VI secretion system protein ImpC